MERSTLRLVLGLLALMLLGTAIFGWFTYRMIASRRHVVAGNAALAKGDRALARVEFAAALEDASHVPGHGGVVADPHLCLAGLDEAEGKLADAEAHLAVALECYDSMPVGGSFGAGAVAVALGRVRLARGDATRAVDAYEGAVRRLEPWKEDADRDMQAALLGLADALEKRGGGPSPDADALRERAARGRAAHPQHTATATATAAPEAAPDAPTRSAAAPSLPASR